MTHDSTDPQQSYDEDDHKDNRSMSDKPYTSSCRRRRTYSDNVAMDTGRDQSVQPTRQRVRAKSGDEYRSRHHHGHLHLSPHTRSAGLLHGFHHHQPSAEDKRPLLGKNLEQVCLDTIAQVATCTMCNCAHSDDSSCDNNSSASCSQSSQSYEKICHPNGKLTKQAHLNKQAQLQGSPVGSKPYCQLSEGGQPNGAVVADIYTDRPTYLTYVPAVGISNGLVPAEQSDMLLEDQPDKANQASKFKRKSRAARWRAYFGLIILLFANTLNYMDRYTIAGVLLDVKNFYGIHNSQVGLLQTSFILSYMVFSPIFGFLGDRYSRKIIMSVGIFSWSLITLGSSFIGPDRFYIFLLMRALVGIGEASYSTIAPTIIADLYVDTSRTKALSVFYFAIPVGSGLGYIAGSKFAAALGGWQWALRITPGLGVLCVILILLVVQEPQRGAAEGGSHIQSTSWLADLKYLFKHKSFLLSSAGFTCVAFVAGAMALWTPTYMYYSIRQRPQMETESNVSMIFGLITCGSGFTGVALGSWTASKLRHTMGSKADPLVCAVGLIGCAPFLFLSLHFSRSNPIITWVLIFIGETLLSLNWALVTDILLYIVVPTRRATAEAVQILLSHALGDAGSPYLVGMIADTVAASAGFPEFRAGQYISLQYAMYTCCFTCVIGGGFFLGTAIYIQKDRDMVDNFIKKTRAAAAEKVVTEIQVGINNGDVENSTTTPGNVGPGTVEVVT